MNQFDGLLSGIAELDVTPDAESESRTGDVARDIETDRSATSIWLDRLLAAARKPGTQR